MAETYTCFRCGVTYLVKPARRNAETTTCAEPACDIRFWHSKTGGDLVRVGIDPKDVPTFEVAS